MNHPSCLAAVLLALLCTSFAAAGVAPSGQVQLPLDDYTALLKQASDPARSPRPAPAGYALGSAILTVTVSDVEPRASASIDVQLGIEVLEEEWVLVPVLPPGTPVESVTAGGKPVQLLATPQGLAWSTRKPGSYVMRLRYRVDATRSGEGFTLPVPLPEAAAIQLTATLPGTGLDTAVIPSAGAQAAAVGSSTRVTATIPTTSGVQISWREGHRGHTVSRAGYTGKLVGDAIVWTGRLGVELFGEESVTLPLFPRTVTLSDLQVDGKPATIFVEESRFATLVRGRGKHVVEVVFQTPVRREAGPPRVDFEIPEIPVSRFELELPGKKELTVHPAASVTSTMEGGSTVAVVHVPMTSRISVGWSEAVPDEVKAEVRSSAATYHTMYAEEGVLYVQARMMLDVTRGKTKVIELEVPADVQINRIDADSDVIADWRIQRPEGTGPAVVSVFLDRELSGPLLLDVVYDRSLQPGADGVITLEVPTLRMAAAQRQKGMVALLASAELTLHPREVVDATRVGENQLPAFVRDMTQMTVAHTFKYAEASPRLLVEVAAPERAQGKFDAQVDTLVSLGDVTLTGSATVQVNVKSGRIMDLAIELPEGVSLLNLTAPALRAYKVGEEDDPRAVEIEFTQEMDGQFRVELLYERILSDAEAPVPVPTLGVRGAEVEQGRIAVEALSAAEVLPAVAEQLTALDVNELPQQLVLRTTNPILLAYKYVHAQPRHRLALQVTRHAVLGVQEAAIDRAAYRTLFTRDGLLVTTAEFTVRNSRKQFLRVRLPEGSEVWSAFVDGRSEKPAMAGGDAEGGRRDVLIKIINSTRPFAVQLIYGTKGARIAGLGTVAATLPDPDILVTHSRWDVFVPEDNRYGEPVSNMDLVQEASPVSGPEMDAEFARLEKAAGARQVIEPLRILVPAAGVHYAFEKLYANQAEQEAWFRLAHASPSGFLLGQALSLLGVALIGLGADLALRPREKRSRLATLAPASLGGLALFLALGVFRLSPALPAAAALVVTLVLAVRHGRRHVHPWRPLPTPDQS